MVSLISRIATRRGMTVLIILFAVVYGLMLVNLGQLSEVSGGYGILDFERGYTAERVNEVLGSYGAEGMVFYNRIQLLDLIFPVVYSLLAAGWTYLLWRNRGPNWLCLMPFLGAMGDYAENATLFLMSRSFPQVPEGLVAVSSTLSLIKNGLFIVAILPLLVGLAMWVFLRVRGMKS